MIKNICIKRALKKVKKNKKIKFNNDKIKVKKQLRLKEKLI